MWAQTGPHQAHRLSQQDAELRPAQDDFIVPRDCRNITLVHHMGNMGKRRHLDTLPVCLSFFRSLRDPPPS